MEVVASSVFLNMVKNKSNINSAHHWPSLCVCVFFLNPEGRRGIPKKHTTSSPELASFGVRPDTTLPCPCPVCLTQALSCHGGQAGPAPLPASPGLSVEGTALA